jgi:hypothetical protein
MIYAKSSTTILDNFLFNVIHPAEDATSGMSDLHSYAISSYGETSFTPSSNGYTRR